MGYTTRLQTVIALTGVLLNIQIESTGSVWMTIIEYITRRVFIGNTFLAVSRIA